MANEIGALRVEISASAARLESDMGKVRRTISSSAKNMSRSMNGIKGSVAGAATAIKTFVAAWLGFQSIKLAKDLLDFADTIAKTADRLGVGVEQLQEYQHAASLSGLSTEEFNKALQFFVKGVGEAKEGTGTMVTFLGKSNEAFLDQLTSARSTGEALDLFMEKLAGTSNSFEKAALAATGFGAKTGSKMINVVKNGVEGFAAMRAEARSLGLVLSERFARQAEDAVDQLGRMVTLIKVNLVRLLIPLTPHFIALGEGFIKLAAGLTGFFDKLAPARWASFEELENRLVRLDEAIKRLRAGERNVPFGMFFLDPRALPDLERMRKEVSTYIDLEKKRQKALGALFAPPPTQRKKSFEDDFGDLESFNKALERAKQIFTETRTPLEELNLKLAELRELQKSLREVGFEDEELFSRAIAKANVEFQRAIDKTDELKQAFKEAGDTFGRAIEDLIVDGKKGKEVLEDMLRSLARIILQKSVLDPLGNLFTSAGPGILRSILPFLAGGGRISGPAIVGERGPELFSPSTSGTIIPNHQIGRALTSGPTIFADLRGADASAVQRLEFFVRSLDATLEKRAMSAVMNQAQRGGSFPMALRGR